MGDTAKMTCDACSGRGCHVVYLCGRAAYPECAECAGAGYVLVRLGGRDE